MLVDRLQHYSKESILSCGLYAFVNQKIIHGTLEFIFVMLSECSHSSIHVALSKVFNANYVKQNCIYVTESVHFQTLMSVKRSRAFVQTACASTRLAVSVVNAPRGSVTMTCSWSAKVI